MAEILASGGSAMLRVADLPYPREESFLSIGGCAAAEDRLGPGSTQVNASLDGNVVFIPFNEKLYSGESTCKFFTDSP